MSYHPTGVDVDTEKIVSALRELADSIEAGDCDVTHVSTQESAHAESLIERGLDLEWTAPPEANDRVEFIDYD